MRPVLRGERGVNRQWREHLKRMGLDDRDYEAEVYDAELRAAWDCHLFGPCAACIEYEREQRRRAERF